LTDLGKSLGAACYLSYYALLTGEYCQLLDDSGMKPEDLQKTIDDPEGKKKE